MSQTSYGWPIVDKVTYTLTDKEKETQAVAQHISGEMKA